ncbi:MAG: hypothetical protein ACRDIF_08145, partial [Actinomycetota bacterium]
LEVPTPRAILAGLAAIAGLAMAGVLLTWIGIWRLSSGAGLALLLLGGFLMLLAVFAPAFKLLDTTLRLTGRLIGRQRSKIL